MDNACVWVFSGMTAHVFNVWRHMCATYDGTLMQRMTYNSENNTIALEVFVRFFYILVPTEKT